jgi:golgi phosphoprotein 3
MTMPKEETIMTSAGTLHLHECIMLLVLRDREGTIASGSYQYAVGGAVLAELMLQKRIDVQIDRKKQFARLLSDKPCGDPLLVAEQLVRRGILRRSKDKVLGIFNRTIYPELDPRPERELIARLEAAVFGDAQDIDTRTAVLISLANGAGLLRLVFDKKRLKGRRARIRQISNGELVGKATAEAIQAMQTAVMVACIVPVMAGTAASR